MSQVPGVQVTPRGPPPMSPLNGCWRFQRRHSSVFHASRSFLFCEVSILPLPLASTQSSRFAAIIDELPVPRLLTITKRPSKLTAVRLGSSAPPFGPVR